MKLIFLGDSLTEGSYGGNYVAHIAKLRPQDTIINAGVGGDTVINLERRLEDVIDQSPDGVFMMVGANDVISYTHPETRPYYKQVKQIDDGFISPATFFVVYREIIMRLQANHIHTWIGLPPIEYDPWTVATMGHFNMLAQRIANAFNIPYLDLMPQFTPQTLTERKPLNLSIIRTIGERVRTGWSDYDAAQAQGGFTYTFDGIHLTPKSAVQFAERIHHFIGD